MGIMTSLINGLPRRDTCSQGPVLVWGVVPYIRTFWRLAVVQTPIVESASVYFIGIAPPLVRSVIGTCKAIECTFVEANEWIPALAAPFKRKSGWKGRRSPRSKIDPRST